MSDKRCPNCGACKECGHAPQPFRFTPSYPYFYPYWTTVRPPQPYYYGSISHPSTGNGNTVTWNDTSGGSYQ